MTTQFLSVSDLKKRGWTAALIARFLGAPDELRTNPHYSSARPMRLYKIERVEQVESSVEFRQAQDSRKGKIKASQKALATKKQRIAEYIATVEIKVPELAKEELIRRACDNYNAWTNGDSWASEHSSQEFLERICVNYLRHCLTEYETHLRKVAGKVGARDAYRMIKTKVLKAIGDKCDWLAEECGLQEGRMWAEDDFGE